MPGPSVPGTTPPSGYANLPSNWQNLPTTQLSESAAIAAVQANLGSAAAADFTGWYDAALATDPSITPNQAVATWVTGSTIAQGLGATSSVLSQVPQAAGTAANSLTVVPGFADVLDITSGLAKIGAAITAFFAALEDWKLWASVGWGVLGALSLFGGVFLWLRQQGLQPPVIPIPV